MNLLGVVLCGGQSTRMGEDKGLMQTDGITWAQSANEKLIQLGLPTLLSVNQQQVKMYASIFLTEKLVQDDNSLDIKGPLLGLLSVHSKFAESDLLVLACDLPHMSNVVLDKLTESYSEGLPANAIVFKNDNQIEPLCGIYKAAALASILSSYQCNQLSKFSLIHLLEEMNAHFIPVKPEWKSTFHNFNSREDLNIL